MLFGELAILYNCRRTASIKCKTDCSLWAMERSIFQAVVKSAGQAKDEEKFSLLSTVKDLKQFPESKLRKIADCLEEETFEPNQLIFKEGNKLPQVNIYYLTFKVPVVTFSTLFEVAKSTSLKTMPTAARTTLSSWDKVNRLVRRLSFGRTNVMPMLDQRLKWSATLLIEKVSLQKSPF